jgi:hypothetical protein
VNEQAAHAAPVVFSEYLVEELRDILENWQSEFLQLMWQVAALALLVHRNRKKAMIAKKKN